MAVYKILAALYNFSSKQRSATSFSLAEFGLDVSSSSSANISVLAYAKQSSVSMIGSRFWISRANCKNETSALYSPCASAVLITALYSLASLALMNDSMASTIRPSLSCALPTSPQTAGSSQCWAQSAAAWIEFLQFNITLTASTFWLNFLYDAIASS